LPDPIWPTFDQVRGVLYELATGLYGLANSQLPAFKIRDRGLLESAIALPRQSQYETFFDGLAAMVRSITENHPLADGNKRLAVAVLHGTLLVNGYAYVWSDVDVATLVERCAKREIGREEIAEFIEAWTGRIGGDVRVPMELDALAETIEFQRASVRLIPETLGSQGLDVLAVCARHASGQLTEADRVVVDRALARRRDRDIR
jgi:death-on-curing protein